MTAEIITPVIAQERYARASFILFGIGLSIGSVIGIFTAIVTGDFLKAVAFGNGTGFIFYFLGFLFGLSGHTFPKPYVKKLHVATLLNFIILVPAVWAAFFLEF